MTWTRREHENTRTARAARAESREQGRSESGMGVGCVEALLVLFARAVRAWRARSLLCSLLDGIQGSTVGCKFIVVPVIYTSADLFNDLELMSGGAHRLRTSGHCFVFVINRWTKLFAYVLFHLEMTIIAQYFFFD